MECKFLDHGLAIAYDGVIKPCCDWSYSQEYANQNQYSQINLDTWHQSKPIVFAKKQLAQGYWPNSCNICAKAEQQNKTSSMRSNAASAYSLYGNNDITLEIRPGNVCNFACQTCWPEASSRVTQFYSQANIIDIKSVVSNAISNFDFLLPTASRIKNVILLGGEPFYDKNCLKFLQWATQNLTADITMFTNGSAVDWNWVDSYPGKITMVFSIDAAGLPAEYIRFGTVWSIVEQNFKQAQANPKIQVRVNITASVYNYYYISDVVDLLIPNWPQVVSFGTPREQHFLEHVVPEQYRGDILQRLEQTVANIENASIELGQKQNAVNAIKSIMHNLQTQPWNQQQHTKLCDFVSSMDQVKKVTIGDYSSVLAKILKQPSEIL